MELDDLMSWREQIRQVWDREKWKAEVQTKYKPVGRKIKPMNVLPVNGESPGGKGLTFEERGPSVEGEMHGGKTVPRGSRLTPERLTAMNIGGDFLTMEEKQLFIDILFEYEGAIAFDESEMGMLHSDVEPPVKINTVPHQPWQQQNLRLP